MRSVGVWLLSAFVGLGCVRLMEPDQFPCYDDDDCVGGYVCIEVEDAVGYQDGICREIGWCEEDSHCDGRICNATTNQCEGEARTACDRWSNNCEEGFGCSGGYCVRWGGVDGACDHSDECDTGYGCQDDQCTKWGGVDGVCDYSSECDIGYECQDDQCTKWGHVDGPCDYDSDCFDGYDCQESLCACVTPSFEVCDGVDNDCSGEADSFSEGFVCGPKDGALWQVDGEEDEVWVDGAVYYCGALEAEAREDWYLPSMDDYRAILSNCGPATGDDCDSCVDSPECNSLFPDDLNTYWAKSRYNSAVPYTVNLATGEVVKDPGSSTKAHVRCMSDN